MNRSMWLRTGATMALPLAMMLPSFQVHAETPEDASFSLKLATALRERTFMRAGVVYTHLKTTSGDAYDVTGPVVKVKDLENAAPTSGLDSQTRADMVFASDKLDGALNALGINGLGAPAGVRVRGQSNLATPTLSLGYYLTDDFTWVIEAYVLAAPLEAKIYGAGTNSSSKPIAVNGKHILTTKLLPPLVNLGRYWGERDAKFRPYTGLMGMYAIFFDTKATQSLNDYMGGGSPGDTTVSLKNAFGIGPALGFKYNINDSWHVSLNVGSVKLKTQGTLTTRNTTITSNSAVINDYPQLIIDAINTTKSTFDTDQAYIDRGGSVTVFMRGLATSRGGNDGLGTYVRKSDTTLTNTLMMLSVGHSF